MRLWRPVVLLHTFCVGNPSTTSAPSAQNAFLNGGSSGLRGWDGTSTVAATGVAKLAHDQIRSKTNQNFCVTVRDGKIADGSDLILSTCDNRAAFKWVVQGDQIRYRANQHFCMSIRAGSVRNFPPLALWSCDDTKFFHFIVDQDVIRAKAQPEMCLVVRGGQLVEGADVIVWPCREKSPEYQWVVASTSVATPRIDAHRHNDTVSPDLIRYGADPRFCASVREGRPGDGADVILWSCSDSAEFRWVLHGDKIRYSADLRYCMSVREGNIGNGADIVLWTCHDDYHAFHWSIDGDRIKHKADPSFCISVREGKAGNGSDMILWRCDNSDAFGWDLQALASAPDLPEASHQVRYSGNDHYCISLKDGNEEDGSRLVLWSCSNQPAFQWVFDGTNLRYWVNQNFCAAVRDAISSKGVDIVLWSCNEDPAFEWVYLDGELRFKAQPDLCISVDSGKVADGSGLILWTCHREVKMTVGVLPYWNLWKLSMASGGLDQIRLRIDQSYCIAVRDEQVLSGSKLILRSCADTAEFKFVMDGDKLHHRADKTLCVAVNTKSGGTGYEVVLLPCVQASSSATWKMDGHLIRSKFASKQCLAIPSKRHRYPILHTVLKTATALPLFGIPFMLPHIGMMMHGGGFVAGKASISSFEHPLVSSLLPGLPNAEDGMDVNMQACDYTAQEFEWSFTTKPVVEVNDEL